MIIRAACEDDVPAICALLSHPSMRGAVLPRTERSIGRTLEQWLVGTDDRDRVVGCIALAGHRADLAEIRSLAVSPVAAGQGFGSALLRSAVGQAWQRGIPSVFAQTRALALFERVGFRHMEDEAEHRPLCGRLLRSGYHRVRMDAPPLSVDAPDFAVGPAVPRLCSHGSEGEAAVGRVDANAEGAEAPITSHPDGIAPPGFHFHRYRSVAATQQQDVI